MSKDRDGSVRARKDPVSGRFYARYKYSGRWYRVLSGSGGTPMLYARADDAREAAYTMYNVAVNGGVHQ